MATDETASAQAELNRVERMRTAASAQARSTIRRQMITTGVWSAAVILICWVSNRWISDGWARLVLFALALWIFLRAVHRIDAAAPVHVKPARRAVLAGGGLALAGALPVILLLGNGLAASVAGAAVAFCGWALGGWWATR